MAASIGKIVRALLRPAVAASIVISIAAAIGIYLGLSRGSTAARRFPSTSAIAR